MFAYMMRELPTLLDAVVEEINNDKDHSETFRTEPWSQRPEPDKVVETEYVRRVKRLIEEGRDVVLVGETGAGKSTTAIVACENPAPVVLTFSENIPISILKTFVNTLRMVGLRRLLSADAVVVGDAVIEGRIRRLTGIDELTVLLTMILGMCISRAIGKPIVAMLATNKKYYRRARKMLELMGFEVIKVQPDERTVREILKAYGVKDAPKTDNPRRELKRFFERSPNRDRSDERVL